jgi:oligosaccharide repeat unit polymerase
LNIQLTLIYIFTIWFGFKIYNSLSGGNIFIKPTILNWTLAFWLLPFCLTGSYLLCFGTEVYFLKGSLEKLRVEVFYLIVYTIFTIAIGYFFHQNLIKNIKNNFRKVNFSSGYINIKLLKLLLLISFFAGVYTILKSSQIPLFDLISGNNSNLLLGRSSIKFNFQGINFIKNIFFNKSAIIVSFMLFSNYLNTNKNRKWAVLAIIWAMFSELYTLEKAPIAFYLFSLFLINRFHKKNLSFKSIITVGVSLFILLIILYVTVKEGGFSFMGILNRILFVPLTGLYYSLSIFPENYDFLMGASFPNWMTSNFGVESIRSARLVMQHVNPQGVELGTAGVVSSLFIAEAYANFGKFGLYFSPILVGFVISILDTITSRKIFNRINPGLTVYFIVYSPILGGFIDFIWNVSWFFILVILYLINKRIKI